MSPRLTKRVYWVATGTLSVAMLLSGAGDLLRFQPFVDDLRRLGYPNYLLTLLGIAKWLGVAALLHPGHPRLKEWAYAGFTFDLGGATISQLVSGSTIGQILPPVVCGSLVAVSYLAYRALGREGESEMPKARYAPEGWRTVTPRIVVERPESLVDFVKSVFGATGDYHPDRPTELRIGDSILMISGATARGVMPAFLYVYVESTDATYQRALDAGATSVESPRETPYGDRRAMIRDSWGNTWQIATHRGRFTP